MNFFFFFLVPISCASAHLGWMDRKYCVLLEPKVPSPFLNRSSNGRGHQQPNSCSLSAPGSVQPKNYCAVKTGLTALIAEYTSTLYLFFVCLFFFSVICERLEVTVTKQKRGTYHNTAGWVSSAGWNAICMLYPSHKAGETKFVHTRHVQNKCYREITAW